MALKPSVYFGVSGGIGIRNRLSPQARHLISDAMFDNAVVNLIVFPHSSTAVVTSKAIEKVLERTKDKNGVLLFVAWDLTVEARKLLGGVNALVLSENYFGWSDERWHAVRER